MDSISNQFEIKQKQDNKTHTQSQVLITSQREGRTYRIDETKAN